MEDLWVVSCHAVDFIDFISGREEFKRRGSFRRVVTGFHKLRSQLCLGGEMDQINARMEDLSKRRPKAVSRHGPSGGQGIERWLPHREMPYSHTVDNLDKISFSDNVQKIVARLLTHENGFFVISIVGMKGIGKTTLAWSMTMILLLIISLIVLGHLQLRRLQNFSRTKLNR